MNTFKKVVLKELKALGIEDLAPVIQADMRFLYETGEPVDLEDQCDLVRVNTVMEEGKLAIKIVYFELGEVGFQRAVLEFGPGSIALVKERLGLKYNPGDWLVIQEEITTTLVEMYENKEYKNLEKKAFQLRTAYSTDIFLNHGNKEMKVEVNNPPLKSYGF